MIKEVEQETTFLFEEMRRERGPLDEPEINFEPLPEGKYNGRVYILPNVVANEKSPNYGRRKYQIELTVTEGGHTGKMAYHHRVIQPNYLGNKPPETNAPALRAWRERVKEYLRKTDEILSNCGVDTSDTDMDAFVQKIIANNVRRPIVNFTMKNGVAYINHVVEDGQGREVTKGGLFDEARLPDGNDLVLA